MYGEKDTCSYFINHLGPDAQHRKFSSQSKCCIFGTNIGGANAISSEHLSPEQLLAEQISLEQLSPEQMSYLRSNCRGAFVAFSEQLSAEHMSPEHKIMSCHPRAIADREMSVSPCIRVVCELTPLFR